MHRLDFQRLAKIVDSHDAANCAEVRIARRKFGSRILAVENSTKHLAASRSEANSSDSFRETETVLGTDPAIPFPYRPIVHDNAEHF